MKKNEGWIKAGFSRIFWAVLVIVLCAAPCVRADEDIPNDETEYNIPGDFGPIIIGSLNVYGTVNLLTGADIQWFVYATNTSVVNIKGGTVGWLIDVAQGAQVKVYGTAFKVDGVDASGTIPINGYLTGVYGDGVTGFTLLIDCQPGATVTLAAPGGEDPAKLIQALVDKVESFNLHQGIDNSLDAKLDAALNALDDVNENNDVAAINTLQAFINAVEAQSGNKIPVEDANNLIADAQAIIDLLST